ncbi:MAG TPA: hypothetical protein PK737_00300 [Bacilli bacterium]|nr:hypothetical protein [Bacilli bacterium]
MVDWYWERILRQFQSATNVKKVDYNSKYFLQTFSKWLNDQKKAAQLYCELLKDLEIEINTPGITEIGKGAFDSVIAEDSAAQILTPYASSFSKEQSNVQSGHFVVTEKGPIALYEDEATIGNQPNYARSKIVYLGEVERFITHNPYTFSGLNSWARLHNQGYNVAAGIFGKETDADYQTKQRQITNLVSEITNRDFREEKTTIGLNYAHVVVSDREIISSKK